MEISFIKHKDKRHTISCKRTDGSVTYMQSDLFFIQHGESMARKGIVAITVNYRLGVFGFFAHP